MKISHKVKIVVIVAAVLATGFAIPGILKELTRKTVDKCPVGVVFIDPDIKGALDIRYCDKNGVVSTVARRKQRADMERIRGYDPRSRTWILEISNFLLDEDKEEDYLLKINQQGEKRLNIEGTIAVANNLLYETVMTHTTDTYRVDSGNVDKVYDTEVRCYELNGTLRYQHKLQMPNYTVLDADDPATVASSGLAAIAVEVTQDPCTQLLLFDANGKLLKNLGYGSSPEFDSSGKRLLYYDSWTRRLSSSASCGEGSSRLIIYDVETGNKKYLNLNRKGFPPYECSWSPDGKWLVCGYFWHWCVLLPPEQALYAVNIGGDELVWYKYPSAVSSAWWIPVDTSPLKGKTK